MAAVTLLLPSCSGNDSADATELLATIPSDASLVAVANTAKLLEKAGCKIDGSEITPGPELKSLLNKSTDPATKRMVETLFSGESGIDPAVSAIYKVGYYTYATGFLADPAKFRQTVEKETNAKFASEDGIDICANYAVSNSRFWVNLGQGSIDAKEIKHFTALDKAQSFLSNDFAEKLCKFDNDIEGWGNINGLVNTADIPFQQRATIQVALQTTFSDPAGVTFSIDFQNGRLLAVANVLNSKGKHAEFQFPTQELDLKTISSLGGTTEGLAAIAIPNKMIQKLTKETSSQSPSMLGMYLQALQGLDGTAAFAFNSGSGLNGVITTNGANLNALTQFLDGSGINVAKEGNTLRLSKGSVAGPASVDDLAKEMKGAVAGIAVSSPEDLGNLKGSIKNAVFTLVKEGSGIVLKASVKSNDDKENFLLTLIKNS